MMEAPMQAERKTYEPPELLVHGDLQSLTGGAMANGKEGGGAGNPSTKV